MENLELYEAFRQVPPEAQKKIGGGRLKGMTDINPMWRIKKLTERFGPCGIGWKPEIKRFWTEPGNSGEVAAFCEITLSVKCSEQWSEPISGIGGAMLVTKESGGLHTDDECFKKAMTDAISVACKMLGMGADIYWDKDRTKYSSLEELAASKGVKATLEKPEGPITCRECGDPITPKKIKGKLATAREVAAATTGLCLDCYKEATASREAARNG